MAKKSSEFPYSKSTRTMSPPYPHTVNQGDADSLASMDEEVDICPVCDGECTCSNNTPARPPTTIHNPHVSAGSSSSVRPRVTSGGKHTSSFANPPRPKLTLKLTLPPSMLGKRKNVHSSAPLVPPTMGGKSLAAYADYDDEFTGITMPTASSSTHPAELPLRKRGRPKKALAASRRAVVASGSAPRPFPASKVAKHGQGKKFLNQRRLDIAQKKSSTKKRKPVITDSEESSSSELTDVDGFHGLPTFLPASGIISSAADSSESESDLDSISDFDSDSSMEAEEENFIREEAKSGEGTLDHLFGGPHQGNGETDDSDSDASMSDGDVEDDGATEYDMQDIEPGDLQEDEDPEAMDLSSNPPQYVGLATSWSDHDEDADTFDADLFFANLSESGSVNSDSDSSNSAEDDEAGQDGDQSDLDSVDLDEAAANLLPHLRRSFQDLPFEVTEGWDGQIVFTNGYGDGPLFEGDLDRPQPAAFTLQPAFQVVSHAQDADMSESTDYDEDEMAIVGDGDTTDDELVGDDNLPNAKAMRIFSTPFKGVSAVNPLSTMSPGPIPSSSYHHSTDGLSGSPAPADILSGRMFWSDLPEEHEEAYDVEPVKVSPAAFSGTPRQGHFDRAETKQLTIIGDSRMPPPSAFPRRKSRLSISETFPATNADPINLFPRPTSMPPPTGTSSSVPPSTSASEMTDSPAPEPLTSSETIELDDVLDASLLDSDPADAMSDSSVATNTRASDSHQHYKNLSRWDVISVGAFRQTREASASSDAGGWGSDSATDSVVKSPLKAMVWQTKNLRRGLSTAGSAAALAIQDGDRTPTDEHSIPRTAKQEHKQTRRELRKERKLKKKNFGSTSMHPNHQHHQHKHNPNFKSRSTAAAQRTNFFASPSSSQAN